MQPFTLLIKPSGSDCNIDCRYCFYKHRSAEIGQGKQRMSIEVLERLVKDYMALGFAVSVFSWQGGEPTLMGLEFFERAVEFQKKYGQPGWQVSNSLQTNGILLDDKWCSFLCENKFLVGISVDGPKDFHDYYRKNHAGVGTFDKVVRAIEKCEQHKVEFNILVLLNDKNIERPDELFDFFVEKGIRYLQFITCVEEDPASGKIADYSITPQQYGEFLCRIFDRWCEYGPQKLSIRDFDSILSYCLTGKGTICTFDKQCDAYIVVEHTGDCFPCDFFVEPKWRLGNIFETPIEQLAVCGVKREFARAKKKLCNKCLVCRDLALCRGGCIKDKVHGDKQGGRESYFCEGYKMFFDHAMPRFMQIAAAINAENVRAHPPDAAV